MGRSVSAEENKAVIRRLVEEVYNQNDLDVLDELVSQDVVNHKFVRLLPLLGFTKKRCKSARLACNVFPGFRIIAQVAAQDPVPTAVFVQVEPDC